MPGTSGGRRTDRVQQLSKTQRAAGDAELDVDALEVAVERAGRQIQRLRNCGLVRPERPFARSWLPAIFARSSMNGIDLP